MGVDEQTRPMNEVAQADPLGEGNLFGRYLVVGCVGAGGVGEVYAAYDPNLDRRVALKVLKPSDREAVTADGSGSNADAHLVREAKALASLSHPNVVTVHDVGQIDGRTFIAMELVEGCDLAQWLERERERPWRERLAMLIAAGRGLAAAHARNILHRDFKPANVLVGADGRARVSDFGLARPFLGDDATPSFDESGASVDLQRSVTVAGRMVGTPYYMAPEQMDGETTVRSDVYAFCLSLHEAMYGAKAFDAATVMALAVAKSKGPLAPARPGEVPMVVRRAVERGLAPDPGQRWGSMDALLDHLEASTKERSRAFLPWALAVGTVGLAGAVVAQGDDTTTCVGDAERAENAWGVSQKDMAAEAFANSDYSLANETLLRVEPALDEFSGAWLEAQQSTCEATRRGEQSSALMDRKMTCLGRKFVEFEAAVDLLTQGRRETIEHADRLVASLPSLESCLNPSTPESIDPGIESAAATEVRSLIAKAKARIVAGLYVEAETLAGRALEGAQPIEDGVLLADARQVLGAALNKRGKIDDSVAMLEDAVWGAQAVDYTPGQIAAASLLVFVEGSRAGKPEAGQRWLRYAQALVERGDVPADVRSALLGHAGLLHGAVGEFETSLQRFEQAIDVLDADESEAPQRLAGLYDNLGIAFRKLGRYDEAIEQHERALALCEKTLGPRHPSAARTLNNLASSILEAGEFERAETLLKRGLKIREEALGAEHLDVAAATNNLAAVYYRSGRLDEAEVMFRRTAKIRMALLEPNHPKVISARSGLALALEGRGKLDDAREIYEAMLAAMDGNELANRENLPIVLGNFANLLTTEEDFERAAELYERALVLDEEQLGPDHPMIALNLSNLGNVREGQGRFDDAQALHGRALKIREKTLGPEHPDLVWTLLGLGRSHYYADDVHNAIPFLERALRICQSATVGPGLCATVQAQLAGMIWEGNRDRSRALELVRPAVETLRGIEGQEASLREAQAILDELGG